MIDRSGGMMEPGGGMMGGMGGMTRTEAQPVDEKAKAGEDLRKDKNLEKVDDLESLSHVAGDIQRGEKKRNLQRRDVQSQQAQAETDLVQIRIEPFVPIVIPTEKDDLSKFGGQVFLLRHIQIERKHFLQGFKLNESELIAQVSDSAKRLVRSGMGFEVGDEAADDAAHAAILDFGFTDLGLNLIELEPGRIVRQVGQLRNWYFSIIVVVCVAVVLAISSLWRNLRAQLKLTRKKDDFISAVSHELRTPLTTIRMYTEMLDKGWIKTDSKRNEYYSTMLSESERLSRLIENVLDFSRIQRGRKKYYFKIGDVNDCVNDVVDMMTPYAQHAGFTIHKNFDESELPKQIAFDSDAVMQIVINLLDNAIKYATNGEDKTINVRLNYRVSYI